MKNQESIKDEIAINESRIADLNDLQSKADQAESDAGVSIIESFIESSLEPGDTIKGGRSSFSIQRKREGDSYTTEIFTLYFQSDSYKDPGFTHMRISAYSTSESGDFELRRLMTIGRVAKIVLEDKEQILKAINNIDNTLSRSLSREQFGLERETDLLKLELESLRRKEMEAKIVKGITITPNIGASYKVLPELRTSFNNFNTQIFALKIIGYTASGKSANIDFKFKSAHWDNPRIYRSVVDR